MFGPSHCVACGVRLIGYNHHCSPTAEARANNWYKRSQNQQEALQPNLGARLGEGFASQSDWYYDELLADKDDKW